MSNTDDVLDIGEEADTALGQLLGFYTNSPKVTPEGRGFNMYAGLYYHAITQGDHPRFLRATTHQELSVQRRFRWRTIPGLQKRLESVLRYNLERSPIAYHMARNADGFPVWRGYSRCLVAAERRWLDAVRTVLKDIQTHG